MNHQPLVLSLALSLCLAGCSLSTDEVDDDGNGGAPPTESTTTSSGASTTSASSSGAGGGTTNGCVEHWDCSTQEVCIQAECNLAWGRQFRIVALEADIAGTDPMTNTPWDVAGGAPDPYAEFRQGDVALGYTPTVPNDFTPFWNTYADVVLEQNGEEIGVFVWDEDDLSDDDYIIGAGGTPTQWLELVQDPALDGVLTVMSDETTFTVVITPR